MKIHFALPSDTYNVVLDKNDLLKLISTGTIVIHTSREPCTTSRVVLNKSGDRLESLGHKEIYNDLIFYLRESVADLEGGDWSVQFLNITLDNTCREKLQNLNHEDLIKCSNYLIEGIKDGLDSLKNMTELEKLSGYSLKEMTEKFAAGWKLEPPLKKTCKLSDLL